MFAVSDATDALHFNKYAWEEDYHVAAGDGEVSPKLARLIMVCRKTCGTAAPDCHIPLIWRRDRTLGELSGVTQPTYRKRRNALIEAGYLFEIPSGQGHRQTIKVLKMPKWDELSALKAAKRGFDAWCERTGTRNLGWIARALDRAIQDHLAAQSAELEEEDTPPNEQLKESFTANEKTFQKPLYNKEKTTSVDEGGSQDEGKSNSQPSTPPPNPSEKKSSGAKVVDFERVRQLKLALVELFAECGRVLDEGVAMKLARAYGHRQATPSDLRDTLELKLLRLFGDGFKPGQVAQFLLKDAPDWLPSSPLETPSPSSETASETSQKPREMHPFYARIHELEQSGMGYFDAVAQAEDEFDELPGELF